MDPVRNSGGSGGDDLIHLYLNDPEEEPARNSGTSTGENSEERFVGLYQNEGQEEALKNIAAGMDPRTLAAGQQLRPSRSMANLAAAADPRTLAAGDSLRPSRSMRNLAAATGPRDSGMSAVSMGGIERNLNPLALRAGDEIERYREMRGRAKEQLDKAAREQQALGRSGPEKTPEQLRAEQAANANFLAASSRIGTTDPRKRRIELVGARNRDQNLIFPDARAKIAVNALDAKEKAKAKFQSLAKRVTNAVGGSSKSKGKQKEDAAAGPSDTKKPEDPKDPKDPNLDPDGSKDNYDPDDPKGKRRARE